MNRRYYLNSNHPVIAKTNAARERAWNRTDGRLTRCAAGLYYVRVNDELLEIEYQQNEDTGERYWIAREAGAQARWNTDPVATLTELRNAFGGR